MKRYSGNSLNGREEIYPALSPAYLGILLEELETVGYINIYINIKDGKAYPGHRAKAKSTKTKPNENIV